MVKIIFGKLIDIRCILMNLINKLQICFYIKVILILFNINYLIESLLFLSSILIILGNWLLWFNCSSIKYFVEFNVDYVN